MKKMNKSDISLIKNIIFLFITITLLTSVILLLVIPKLEDYKTNSINSRQNMAKLNIIKTDYDKTLKEFTKLQTESKAMLDSFQNNFSISKFLKDTNQFFQNSSINEISEDNNNTYFKVYEFEATSDIKTPTTFYKFLEYLSKYENIIEVDFPIIFNSKANLISAKFRLKIHNLKR
jgi:hypothetical protein